MTEKTGSKTAAPQDLSRLRELLAGLPPESVVLLEQFAEFLRQQSERGEPVGHVAGGEPHPFRYPNVPLPASLLKELTGILPPVGGDALTDTEALYDEG